MTNFQEYVAGTNPKDFASKLHLDATNSGSGKITLSVDTVADRSYSIVYRDASVGGAWLKLTDFPAGAGGPKTVVDQLGAGVKQRFYQVVTPALAP